MKDIDLIREQLERLYRSVGAAELPENFRVVAFQELLRAQLFGDDSPTSSPAGTDSGGETNAEAPTSGLEVLAHRVGVDVSELADVYELTGGEIELLVPAKALATTASEATRQLALLVAAGRQGSGIEEATSFDRIRAACVDYRKYDPKNFATHLAAMDDVFLIRGKGRQREVRMARPGWARAGEVVRQLVRGSTD